MAVKLASEQVLQREIGRAAVVNMHWLERGSCGAMQVSAGWRRGAAVRVPYGIGNPGNRYSIVGLLGQKGRNIITPE